MLNMKLTLLISKHGDCLLFYTDGLIDAANFDGEMWGKTNLIKTTKKFGTLLLK